MRILIVEDDLNIAQLIETILHQENYAVDLAADGQIGLDLSESYEYDLILLDVSLPKRDGISICQEVRSRGSQVPVLLLTALDSPADRARGLNAGADDYLGKPFDPIELLARVHALLRRSSNLATPILSWGELQLDPLSATVTYADQPVAVTPKEYAMLELFLRNSKRVFSCSAILDHLWSYDEAPSEEAIRTHIKGLRQKLRRAGATADCVETVYGIGYRLKPLTAPPPISPTSQLLTSAWEKFKNQIHEQVAILEQLAVRSLNKDLQVDWHRTGQDVAHSLAGSLGSFGFPLGSELAKQIEQLLSAPQKFNDAQGQQLYSLVAALQQELDRPLPLSNISNFDSDQALVILLISADPSFMTELPAAALEKGWQIEIATSIATARTQLHNQNIRSILIAPSLANRSEDLVQLLVEVSKHVPAIPVILNSTTIYPELEQIGICVNLPPTSVTNTLRAIELAITEVERRQTHILIVDDDPKVSAILQAMLTPWGLKVTTLGDPQQFWLVLNSNQPHLLILDVEMPGVSGLELCRQVRHHSDWSELPIIFLTAHHGASLIQEVFAIGADDFVTKPIVEPEIVLRILNLLERKRLQRVIAHHQSSVNLTTLSPHNRLQFSLTRLQDSLNLLENDLASINYLVADRLNPTEIHQLFQNICAQVRQLHELIPPDSENS